MSTLHEQLVAELDHARRARGRDEMVAALRVVVELHKPVTFWRPWGDEPPSCQACKPIKVDRIDDAGTWTEDSQPAPWPCSTIQAIARELGVDG